VVDIEHEEVNDVEAGVVQAIEDCAAEKEILQTPPSPDDHLLQSLLPLSPSLLAFACAPLDCDPQYRTLVLIFQKIQAAFNAGNLKALGNLEQFKL